MKADFILCEKAEFIGATNLAKMESKLVLFLLQLLFRIQPHLGGKFYLVELAQSPQSGGHEEDEKKDHGHEKGNANGHDEDSRHGKDHKQGKDNGHREDREHWKGHGQRKYHRDVTNHGHRKDQGQRNGHRIKHGKRKDHAVTKSIKDGWDYDFTREERCRGLKALCEGRLSCLEAMNKLSQMQLYLQIILLIFLRPRCIFVWWQKT